MTVEICNGGTAIDSEQMKRLFEPFYTSKASGTGLGLPIVKRIIEAHGGRIDITSSQSEGTRVSIRLPTRMDDQA